MRHACLLQKTNHAVNDGSMIAGVAISASKDVDEDRKTYVAGVELAVQMCARVWIRSPCGACKVLR